jgi:type I restriction enzyme M protein
LALHAEISKRIKTLFNRVKQEYDDVFDGNEEIILNERALSFIAAELSRYSFLSTDTDAKGTAYEAITSTTLKRERGQFFTPRNVIRMMVDMISPEPGKKLLDPACGSGGFLVVALSSFRRNLLASYGCPYPDRPIPSELKKVDPEVRKYAGSNCCRFGHSRQQICGYPQALTVWFADRPGH